MFGLIAVGRRDECFLDDPFYSAVICGGFLSVSYLHGFKNNWFCSKLWLASRFFRTITLAIYVYKPMKVVYAILILFLQQVLIAQVTEVEPHCVNDRFHKEVRSYLDGRFPVVDVDELRDGDYVLLDAREKEEYSTSHLPDALWVGYDDFNMGRVGEIDKNQPVAVYCSIGYRSERIAKRLKKAGFTRVYNVYGSLFEWANRGYPLKDASGKSTNKVHTYNRKWSKWVDHPEMDLVW